MIKAVIFDIDGVLLDSFEANLKFVQDLLKKTGYPPPTREKFPELFHRPLFDIIKICTGLTSANKIRKIWEMGKNREVPYPFELLRTPEGARETVKKLSAKYPLAIVTSRVREAIFDAPALKALQNYFKVAVAYQDTENHKPHPDPLLLAAKKLAVVPERAVYVGDVENDVKAGKAAGMKVIIYGPQTVPGAYAWTAEFSQIPKLLQSINHNII